LIECAARLIGQISPSLSQAVLGTDQVSRLADLVTDPAGFEAARAGRSYKTAANGRVVALVSDVAGTVRGDLGGLRARLASLPTARSVHFFVEPAGPLVVTQDLATFPGAVELCDPDDARVEADHAAIRALEREGCWRHLV